MAALSPPLVSDASTDGTLELAWSTRLVVIWTTWPLPCFSISAMASCVMWKKPARLTPTSRRSRPRCTAVNGLAMKMPALLTSVSMRPKRATAFGDDALGGLRIGDVAGDGENVVIVRRLDRARGGDDAVVAFAIGLDERRADALRCAGDDCDFLFGTHG